MYKTGPFSGRLILFPFSIRKNHNGERSAKPACFCVTKIGKAIAQHFRTLKTSSSKLSQSTCNLNSQEFANHIPEFLVCFQENKKQTEDFNLCYLPNITQAFLTERCSCTMHFTDLIITWPVIVSLTTYPPASATKGTVIQRSVSFIAKFQTISTHLRQVW